MLNLVNQKKKTCKEVHCDFTSNDYVKKLHFCYISKGYIISHKSFWIHQYLYFHKIYMIIVGTQQDLAAEAWNNIQDIKNGVSNSYFVKIKTFRLQTSKLLGNITETYILDVICNKFYFREVHEEVLGQVQWAGYLSIQKISSICLSVVCSRKSKTSRLVEEMPL